MQLYKESLKNRATTAIVELTYNKSYSLEILTCLATNSKRDDTQPVEAHLSARPITAKLSCNLTEVS